VIYYTKDLLTFYNEYQKENEKLKSLAGHRTLVIDKLKKLQTESIETQPEALCHKHFNGSIQSNRELGKIPKCYIKVN
jgi:hypothetical protein